jgi:hypothetical protein
MKIFNKLLILMVLAALAGPFFLKKPDGTPFLNWRDFIPQNPLESVKESVVPSPPKKMYKWKDAKGHWQFGDMPPEGVAAQEMQVKTQINEMKTIELPEGFRDEPEQQQAETSRFDPTQKSATPLSTAPLTEVPKMLDQIEQFQGKLDERQKSLDAL